MITIKNLKNDQPKEVYDIICDKTSVYGNRFRMNGEAERNYVCDLYRDEFDQKLEDDANFRAAMLRLVKLYQKHGKLNLFCHCAPKRCHVETIKKKIEEAMEFMEKALNKIKFK